jgi:hypothetical protein
MTPEIIEALQPVLETLVGIVATALMGMLAALVNEKIAQARTSKYAAQWELAYELVSSLMSSARQNAKMQKIAADGEALKQWVLDKAEVELARKGMAFDLDAIDDLIEAIYDEKFATQISIPPEWLDPTE